MPTSKRISKKLRVDPDGGFRINNEIKPLIKRARDLGAAPTISQIIESNRFINLNKSTGVISRISFFRDFALCPDLNPMGGPRITFTRASSATRVNQAGLIELMGTNVPRFEYDPITRAAKGLLIEESRTNSLIRSEEFNNATWTKAGSSVVANSIISPGGLLTADSVIEDSSTGRHIVEQIHSVALSTTATFSVFIKQGTRRYASIQMVNGAGPQARYSVVFDLEIGTITATESFNSPVNTNSTITALANGWYRVTATMQQSPSSTTFYTSIAVSNSATPTILEGSPSFGSPSYTGDGTSGIYVWGAQLEIGNYVSSYISTGASSVTRAADMATIDGNNFIAVYNQTEGTILGEWLSTGVTSTKFTLLQCRNGGSADGGLGLADSNARGAEVFIPSFVLQASLGVTVPVVNSKAALAYRENDFAAAFSGAIQTDSAGSLPRNIIFYIGNGPAAGQQASATFSKIFFYSKRLSNTIIQSLTG